MSFITFIYRLGNNKKTFYGKYVGCENMSDDHEGLDKEIEPVIIDGINEYRKQKGLTKLKTNVFIGVLSFSISDCIPIFSSDDEIKCFDFYHEKHICAPDKTYINGKLIK